MKSALLLVLAAPLYAAPFTVSSPAFTPGGALPAEFTCDGERASPPLQWSNAPAGTRSFAVTMHHIPGPGDRHVYLVIYNIPGTVTSLAKNSRTAGSWGVNTVDGQAEYTPPCSQGPGPKTYTLTVYALSAEAKLSGTVTMEALLNAIQDKTLATAAIDVTYSRAGRDGSQPQRPGPRLPPELDRALSALTLTPAQKEAIQAIVQQFAEQQRHLRDDLLQQLKTTLTPEQFQQVQAAARQPPPRPN